MTQLHIAKNTLFSLAVHFMMPLLLAASILLFGSRPSHANDLFSFIVISDVPYSKAESQILDSAIAPAIRKNRAPFVIHMGDFKNSTIPCSDALMTERRDQILSLHPGRVFYTPGDNDWTDCDRNPISIRFSELDRLDLLRRLFYTDPHILSPIWAYARQSLYPENMRWFYKGVVFSTVHLVSTNNGRTEILLDDEKLALDRVDARDRANEVWLEDSFNSAERIDAKAIVIATQADVTKFRYPKTCTHERRVRCDAFASFKKKLKQLAETFKKPVLLVHGDTNPYCLDKEFGKPVAPNLWRFNSTGDYSFVDAVNITVTQDTSDVRFSFLSLVDKKPPADGCGKK